MSDEASRVFVVDHDAVANTTTVRLVVTSTVVELSGPYSGQGAALVALAHGAGVSEVRIDSTGVGHVLLSQLEDADVKLVPHARGVQ